jgi:hypothetical protein
VLLNYGKEENDNFVSCERCRNKWRVSETCTPAKIKKGGNEEIYFMTPNCTPNKM